MPLEHALTLLDLESSGGLNVYGASKPPHCGPLVGTPVTAENYRTYLERRAECKTQGVGPMQLTHESLQTAADAEGGCWDPAVNVRVGLRHFRSLLDRHGMEGAYSAYNTGKPGPSPYLAKALPRLTGWRRLLADHGADQ